MINLSLSPNNIAVELIPILRSSLLSYIAYIVSNIVTHTNVAKKKIQVISFGYLLAMLVLSLIHI